MNGLVSADCVPHPGLLAIKRWYKYVQVKPVDLAAGDVEIANWHDFTPLDAALQAVWSVQADTKTVASGTLPPLKIPARGKQVVRIPVPALTAEPGVVVLPQPLVPALPAATPWGGKPGDEMAYAQFPLPLSARALLVDVAKAPELALSETGDVITVKGATFDAEFSRSRGTLTSLVTRGVKVIERGPLPDFWRAWTDNDRGAKLNGRLAVWREASESWAVRGVKATRLAPNIVRVDVAAALGVVDATVALSYTPSTAPATSSWI